MSDNITEGHSGRNRKHRRRKTAKPANGPVTTIKVDPFLWAAIMGWSLVNPGRVLAISPDTVILANSPKHREYLRKVYANA